MKGQKKNLRNLSLDPSWTLFLDRDGVISRKLENDYVKTWKEFEFLPGVLKVMMPLAEVFGRIIVVTNQRGIGRELMREDDLQLIHWNMTHDIQKAGGRIDAIYYCPHNLDAHCNCRKPKTGMALKAKKDYPEIDFSKSIMVGDALIDMEFGKQLRMTTILLTSHKEIDKQLLALSDFVFSGLPELAHQLR